MTRLRRPTSQPLTQTLPRNHHRQHQRTLGHILASPPPSPPPPEAVSGSVPPRPHWHHLRTLANHIRLVSTKHCRRVPIPPAPPLMHSSIRTHFTLGSVMDRNWRLLLLGER